MRTRFAEVFPVVVAFGLVSLAGCGGKVSDLSVRPGYKSTSAAIQVGESDWPWWRGHTRNGKAVGPVPPLNWDQSTNIRWEQPIDISGHASPIVVGNRVLIAGSTEAPTQSLLCLDRQTGKEMWHRVLHKRPQLRMHHTNSQASATPASDGQMVFVAMVNSQESGAALMVSAVDLDGKIVWQRNAGSFRSRHGFGSSPVIYKSMVIVAGDNVGPGFLVAFDRKSGDMVWRRGRSSGGSYSTPIIGNVGGKDRLLIHAHRQVTCYDPQSGELQWKSPGPATTTANSMNWDGELVFASGGYPQQNFFALNVSDGSSAWQKRFKVYVPSFVVKDGWIYLVQDNGIARCLNAQSGEEGWKKRLGGAFSSSIVSIGDYLLATSESGTINVFKANPQRFESVSRNSMNERMMATPAICGGEIFIRTASRVVCVGKAKDARK